MNRLKNIKQAYDYSCDCIGCVGIEILVQIVEQCFDPTDTNIEKGFYASTPIIQGREGYNGICQDLFDCDWNKCTKDQKHWACSALIEASKSIKDLMKQIVINSFLQQRKEKAKAAKWN